MAKKWVCELLSYFLFMDDLKIKEISVWNILIDRLIFPMEFIFFV